jgi:hypothetical protein
MPLYRIHTLNVILLSAVRLIVVAPTLRRSLKTLVRIFSFSHLFNKKDEQKIGAITVRQMPNPLMTISQKCKVL